MDTKGLEYLAKKMGALTGIPVRLYKRNEETFYYSTVYLPKDPFLLYMDPVFEIEENVGYYMTKDLHIFGLVRKGDLRFIIGPSIETKEDEKGLKVMAFDLEVDSSLVDDFINGMKK